MRAFYTDFVTKMDQTTMSSKDIQMANPLMLAYIGDGIYELMVRSYMVNLVRGSMNDINRNVIRLVKATSQSYAVRTLEPELSELEMRIVKRARNQKNVSVPKNTPVAEYKLATGFEALLGYLYLDGQEERLKELVFKAIRLIESNPDTVNKKKIVHTEQPSE